MARGRARGVGEGAGRAPRANAVLEEMQGMEDPGEVIGYAFTELLEAGLDEDEIMQFLYEQDGEYYLAYTLLAPYMDEMSGAAILQLEDMNAEIRNIYN